MSEKMGSCRDRYLEEDKTFNKEMVEKSEPKEFLETMLEVRRQIQETGLLKEKSRDDKAGLEFEGISTEDAKDRLKEADEIKIEGILNTLVEKGFTHKNLDALGENALLLNFEHLSQLFEFFSSIVMELDPASPLKQKLLLLLKNIQAAMRLKAPKQP